jgi:hypothetical protein
LARSNQAIHVAPIHARSCPCPLKTIITSRFNTAAEPVVLVLLCCVDTEFHVSSPSPPYYTPATVL